MKVKIRIIMLLVALVLASTVSFANQPVVTWIDAAGPHQVILTEISTDPGDPYFVGNAFSWYCELNITIDDVYNQVALDFSGVEALWGENSYAVIVKQNVTNNSSYIWDKFWIFLEGTPQGDEGQSFYHALEINDDTWHYEQDLDYIEFTPQDPMYHIMPGQVFRDTISVTSMYDYDDPGLYSDFTLIKTFEGELVPEPGTLAALSAGIVALGGFAVRRRK